MTNTGTGTDTTKGGADVDTLDEATFGDRIDEATEQLLRGLSSVKTAYDETVSGLVIANTPDISDRLNSAVMDPQRREGAIYVLARRGDEKFLQTILQEPKMTEEMVELVLKAVEGRWPEPMEDRLVAALDHSRTSKNAAKLMSLGGLTLSLTKKLVTALTTNDTSLARTLLIANQNNSVSTLIGVLNDQSLSKSAKATILNLLANIGPAAAERLLKDLPDPTNYTEDPGQFSCDMVPNFRDTFQVFKLMKASGLAILNHYVTTGNDSTRRKAHEILRLFPS